MKKIISVSLCLIIFSLSYGQKSVISNDLGQVLEQSDPSSLIRVVVIFVDQVDCFELKNQFQIKRTSVDQRAKIVLRELSITANKSQSVFFEFLENYNNQLPSTYKNVEKHWIINMIVLEAIPDLIEQIAKQDNVALVELDSSRMINTPELPKMEPSDIKSPGEAEQGLITINARALWKMGYSGKGRISYSIDTGVWPMHPAISDRFMANFFPMSYCWFPYDSELPSDKTGSHGTHTLGTTLGLEKSTNDTIGVAFNAYWIASDPVATSMATVKPLSDFMYAFEWALNPDGDTATTYDIPDVINNSWGYSSPADTALCNSYVTSMFNAIEAAGIANVFSAGNDGPGTSTISEPHHISTGLVNTFTVGALNGNDTLLPICGFSSRGPTTCPVTGSLLIKPEVSAPGYNVRSSINTFGYGTANGTSMAAPHVTGAVLLLKEAFPYLPGEEILLALYYSAIDLGDIGEDNTYGMGIIDVLAAYNYLSQTNTPVLPVNEDYELAIKEIISPDYGMTCDSVITPVFIIENLDDSTIQSVSVTYWLNNEVKQYFTWTGNLLTGQTDTIILPAIIAQSFGNYELSVIASIDTLYTESDYINNRRVSRFNIRGVEPLQYIENFESISLTKAGWYILNDDNGVTWDTISTGGLVNSSGSAYIEFATYLPIGNQIDEMISPVIMLPDTGNLFLSFDVAYQFKQPVTADTLKVLISNDCGVSYPFVVYNKGGDDLGTNDSVSFYFIPNDPDDWRKEIVDLTQFAGTGEILLKFQGLNRHGGNLFIDNVLVSSGSPPIGIFEQDYPHYKVYPNPVTDDLVIEFIKVNGEMISVNIINILGETVYFKEINKSELHHIINMSGFMQGLYFVRITQGEKTVVEKIIKGK